MKRGAKDPGAGGQQGGPPPQGSLQVDNHDRGAGDPGKGGQQGGGTTTGQPAGRQPWCFL